MCGISHVSNFQCESNSTDLARATRFIVTPFMSSTLTIYNALCKKALYKLLSGDGECKNLASKCRHFIAVGLRSTSQIYEFARNIGTFFRFTDLHPRTPGHNKIFENSLVTSSPVVYAEELYAVGSVTARSSRSSTSREHTEVEPHLLLIWVVIAMKDSCDQTFQLTTVNWAISAFGSPVYVDLQALMWTAAMTKVKFITLLSLLLHIYTHSYDIIYLGEM